MAVAVLFSACDAEKQKKESGLVSPVDVLDSSQLKQLAERSQIRVGNGVYTGQGHYIEAGGSKVFKRSKSDEDYIICKCGDYAPKWVYVQTDGVASLDILAAHTISPVAVWEESPIATLMTEGNDNFAVRYDLTETDDIRFVAFRPHDPSCSIKLLKVGYE